MKLCNRVREVRSERELTQERLAGMVQVTRQTIIAIEKGGYAPSVELALRLAKALDVPVGNIFWLEETGGGEDE
jgi:putative transcriptional regulator